MAGLVLSAVGLAASASAPTPIEPYRGPLQAVRAPSQTLRATPAPPLIIVSDAPDQTRRPVTMTVTQAPKPVKHDAVAQPKPKPKKVAIPYGDVVRATATWCAPTPKYCHGWDTKYVGAVDSFRWGDEPYRVMVCERDKRIPGKHCTTVTVVSFCACNDRKGIDLSVPAMRELGGMSLGRINVSIQRVK